MNVTRRAVRFAAIFRNISRNTYTAGIHMYDTDEQLPRSIQSDVVSVNGVPIHFEKCGVGRHAILLMPGALGCGRTDFNPQLTNMNREIFTLYAWDPRGYGKSRPPERSWPKDYLSRDADDAITFMEKIGVGKYSILGWADGGTTAMMMAARYPKRIRKLVLWGASAFVVEHDIQMLEEIRDIEKLSDRMRAPMLDVYGMEYLKKHWNKYIDAYARYLKEKDGDICKEELKNIKCNTLIIQGAKDRFIPTIHADFLKEHIRNSELISLPEGKHNIHLRFYREFNSIVETFLLQPDESHEAR